MTRNPAPPLPTVELGYNAIKIKFGASLHLYIPRTTFRGFQSWRWGEKNYCIEYSVEGAAPILCEYDDVEKWKAILAGLEAIL